MNSKRILLTVNEELYEKIRKFAYEKNIYTVPKACLYLIQHDISIDTALSSIEKQITEESKQD